MLVAILETAIGSEFKLKEITPAIVFMSIAQAIANVELRRWLWSSDVPQAEMLWDLQSKGKKVLHYWYLVQHDRIDVVPGLCDLLSGLCDLLSALDRKDLEALPRYAARRWGVCSSARWCPEI